MSHTPQKFITRPHLVAALFYDGSEKSREAIGEMLGATVHHGAGGCAIVMGEDIPPDFWVVKICPRFRALTKSQFEHEYTPFREELKDYPVEIINPQTPPPCP